jgi:hypothetical protein
VIVAPPWEGGDGNASKGFERPRAHRTENISTFQK